METDNFDEINNTTAMVYRVLRKRIIENYYPPNTRLNQNDLAEELKASRTPVVKALHILESDGLVDNIPQRGFYIHQATLGEMCDHFMIRQSIEIVTAANAAESATPEQIEKLYGFFSQFIKSPGPIDAHQYYSSDREFHDYLLAICENRLLNKISESLQILTRTYLGGLLRSPEETLAEHIELIDAIAQHDTERSQSLAMRHINETRKRMKQTMDRLTLMGIDASRVPIQAFAESETGHTLKGNSIGK